MYSEFKKASTRSKASAHCISLYLLPNFSLSSKSTQV